MFKKLVKNTKGATAIEYGLIAAGIAISVVAVVFTLGSQLLETFTTIGEYLNVE